MYNLDNLPTVLDFLKKNSVVFKRINNIELQISCPYCDDGLRANASDHGHLYISLENPVFHCFRCDISGVLPRLLIDMGFNDNECINLIGKTINFNFSRATTQKFIHNQKEINIFENIKNKNKEFILKNKTETNIFNSYISKRIGNFVDYNKFLILISKDTINGIGCTFYNYNGNQLTTRYINSRIKYKRFINNNNTLNQSREYFFQEPNFDIYNNIVICEGPFDIINTYLYCCNFNNNETFYISLLGKKYVSFIDSLIRTEIPIGKYNIHIIFDNDDKYKKMYLYRIKNIVKNINDNITIFGYSPEISKDVGEFPSINEIK